jgi:hypothetical protein
MTGVDRTGEDRKRIMKERNEASEQAGKLPYRKTSYRLSGSSGRARHGNEITNSSEQGRRLLRVALIAQE